MEVAAENAPLQLSQLSMEQLTNVRSQLETELKQLYHSTAGLSEAQLRFQESKAAVHSLQIKGDQEKALIPITSTMFVYGTLQNTGSVLIDIGTGYFVQQNANAAEKFMDRKIDFLDKNLASVKQILLNKRKMLESVIYFMQEKMPAAGKPVRQS